MEVYYYKNSIKYGLSDDESVLFVIGSRMFEISKSVYSGKDTYLTFRAQYTKASNYILLSDTDYIFNENVRNFMLECIPRCLKNEECTIIRTKFKKSLIKLLIKIKNYT